MSMAPVHELVDSFKEWFFPISLGMFVAYPAVLLVWTSVVGNAAAPSHGPLAEEKKDAKTLSDVVKKPAKVSSLAAPHSRSLKLPLNRLKEISAILGALIAVFLSCATGFVALPSFRGDAHLATDNGRTAALRGSAAAQPRNTAEGRHRFVQVTTSDATSGAPFASTVLANSNAAAFCLFASLFVAAARLRRRTAATKASAFSGGVATVVEMRPPLPEEIKHYSAPASGGPSLWHAVDLHAKPCEDGVGTFRYINEIPQGALQKFELQTKDANNAIRETRADSQKLNAFGRPVPFNYGCFPQTYRDPYDVDYISRAPGDDDQLDVVDLTGETVGVGSVVECRPVGAVCLIDEGRADWKILVVNADAKCPLASAQCIGDVERLAPGRVHEVLKWMDDLKKHGDAAATQLEYKIHSVQTAIDLIERDHSSWRRLVAEVGPDGRARGHWIQHAQPTHDIAVEHTAPPAGGLSLWHDVDLHATTWLDEDRGVFRYVNEIPQGALQKFEMQTRDPDNAIRETEKDSKKLKAFGQPVPFNYGCFPQTYRDPEDIDEISGAPGDDDQLDVVDLTNDVVGVGCVVECRPIGAVCLIDEGQADWKILVVNTKAKSALASAHSVEDVERLAPGRIDEALKWMDDLKKHGDTAATQLDFKIHSAQTAIDLIERDHSSWRRLVAEAGPDGRARGHWIRHAQPTVEVPEYSAPPAGGPSLWHEVDLHATTWLDEDRGVFRYVNEIPQGALQKFEMQTRDPDNAIRETEKDSKKLKAFGQPVPFNYGCFPQTYRDPEDIDEISGAPGDDDQLDVVDLTNDVVGVGCVVECRPIGAVCLIDEGQADWKILVVNTKAKSALASAHSVEDVERLAPGRIDEALKWMDDLKKHGDTAATQLDFKIHSAQTAIDLIERDHSSWRRLVAEAGPDGRARGHWIRHAQPTVEVPEYSAPPACGPSLWHEVDLHATTWLDEDRGVFRYVNEIPQGALQKFEMQTRDPDNVIRETEKDSKKLKAFGQPVPFNYGCFPQTYRDPEDIDEISGAPGDDDQLDVVDLTNDVVGVGCVVECRPIGAVCLIDEGQADWKILVVNTKAKSALASAHSVEDVERLAPGRIDEALKWMDDLKKHGDTAATQLDFKIHSAQTAIDLIERDHSSWRRLVAEAGPDGRARGHWIRHAQPVVEVPEYSAPPAGGPSLWHEVDLHATTWLDEDRGVFRYVNEIPQGALQKFEMQTRDPDNAIRETEKDSKKLKAFGQPVPFNYGCFPQTYRDPEDIDEISGAPGDDDQLDVVDLTNDVVGVGCVVECRPIGAVCLIDEGQADWKILVVNTKAKSALATAHSVEDVERLVPGRIDEALKWMDDLKKHGDTAATQLDFKIHSAQTAIDLIERDHRSWRRLVAEAGPDGRARGHWIRHAQPILDEVGADGQERGHQIRESLLKNVLPLILHQIPHYTAPQSNEFSLWHTVSLHAKTWLDEDTGNYRYINEIPRGALQKFEMQTQDPKNTIRETEKDSSNLKAFGRPVPFNYGCFPQTYRDPLEVDELSGAPGDDDPLDVVDLSCETVDVGSMVQCRPIGAVCLIDEGQADWKILVVNTEAKSPFASACSVEDVERVAPGRIDEVLKWMDDLKKHGNAHATKLDFKVYDAQTAVGLIERDHASWRRLVAEAGRDGRARGHWIHPLEGENAKVQLAWPPRCAVPGRLLPSPASFVGTHSLLQLTPAPMQRARRGLKMATQRAPDCGVGNLGEAE